MSVIYVIHFGMSSHTLGRGDGLDGRPYRSTRDPFRARAGSGVMSKETLSTTRGTGMRTRFQGTWAALAATTCLGAAPLRAEGPADRHTATTAATPVAETTPPVAPSAQGVEGPDVQELVEGRVLRVLPLRGDRDVVGLAATAPGVTEASPGQEISAGPTLSVNGMRPRANTFTIDGIDDDDPALHGRQQPQQSPEAVAELRVVTTPFSAALAQTGGASVDVATRAGTDAFHGSAFGLINRSAWNSRSNLDEVAGLPNASFRSTDKWGGTLGGPLRRGRTHFFFDYQRWTDRALGASWMIPGVPTEAG